MQLAAIFGAFGLSGAAGLNAYIPLLVVSVLGRAGVVHLAEPYALITHTWAIALLAALLVVEVIVDKVPGADHINDVIQTAVRPAAGALLFAANAGVITQVHPAVPLVAGLLVAFSVHATKAAARPVVTASTVGVGAPVVSVLEDVASTITSLLAVFAPVIIAVVAALFGAGGYWVWSRRRARRRALATAR